MPDLFKHYLQLDWCYGDCAKTGTSSQARARLKHLDIQLAARWRGGSANYNATAYVPRQSAEEMWEECWLEGKDDIDAYFYDYDYGYDYGYGYDYDDYYGDYYDEWSYHIHDHYVLEEGEEPAPLKTEENVELAYAEYRGDWGYDGPEPEEDRTAEEVADYEQRAADAEREASPSLTQHHNRKNK